MSMYTLPGLSHMTMDGEVPVLVKKEITPGEDNHLAEELIIPDLVPSEGVTSRSKDADVARAIKIEPADTSGFVDGDNDLESPYQCFECGLDCKSQGELIDHYEHAHTEESSRKSESNGSSSQETEDIDDPLAGDVAPDSTEKAANVEGAQSDDAPYEILLLYSCPSCGHSSIDWNHLVKHLEKHVQVTTLSCFNCMYIFSSKYHLKDYIGRDSSDKPHVCCHCPFTTQWYQALKDHCGVHHRNVAPVIGLNHHDQNCTPSSDVSLIFNNMSPTTLVQTASETTNSHPLNYTPLFAMPCEKSLTGCYAVLRSSDPNGQKTNVAVSVQNVLCGVEDSLIGPQLGISFIPQVLNVNPTNHLPSSTVHIERSDTVNPASTLSNGETAPTVILTRGTPPKLSQGALPSRKPKSTNRVSSPKVPVDELLKKWSVTNGAPKRPNVSLKVLGPSCEPVVVEPLTGLPPYRAPRGSLVKSRKSVKNKPCPYCSHLARDSYSLKTHILTHTKEKPFACEYCNYRATQNAHIQKHMKTHEAFFKEMGKTKNVA